MLMFLIVSDVSDVTVTIVSSPAGTPVSGSTNTFDYPILSSVTLTCMVTLFNGGIYTGPYQWNTTGCYTNTAHNSGDPTCFPTGQTTQNVTDNNLLADDAGTITCTVTVNDVDYTSDPLTLRLSGAEVVGGVRTTLSNTIGSSNIVDDYSAIRWNNDRPHGILFRCVTGLGPSDNSNEELGHISFNGVQISHGLCDGPVVQPRGATIANFIGVINVELCSNPFTVNEEGVYTCTIRNSSMVDQTVRVGVYLPVRTAPVITTTLSTINVEFGSPLTLSCTSQGSPPDTFTWMKNGTPAPLTPTLTTVTHDSTTAEFRSDYIINSVTTTDGGTYTCSIANPIGSDSLNVTVTITDVPDVIVTIVSSPAGTPVSGSTNTFDYPILSSVTLTCMVTLFNGGTYTGPYQWNTTGCYTNTGHNSGNPTCFPTGQTTQNVTNNNLLADDAGTITCTVPVNDVDYTSDPLTLRISGAEVVGGARTTLSNTIGSSNIVDDYSAIRWNSIQAPGILFRCVTGLGPSGNSNEELGHISFNGVQISHGLCDGPVVQPRGATIANFIGVINVELCSNTFTVNEEGVYTCTIRNSSMVDQTVRVGVYLPVRTVPVITTTLSTVNVEFGSPLTLSCTSQGSPPDTFTWMKNGTPAPLTPTLTTVTHDSTTAEFRSDYIINSVTTTDGGTYTCSIANSIGSDSLNIAVTITDVPDVIVTIVSSPAGTPVSGSTNTFDYPILSSVTLTCMVTLFNGGTYTGPYQWNTTGCYTNTGHNSGNPTCFPTGQTTQNVTNNNLLADDAGTITCTVPVNEVDYTSDPLTLRISGAEVVGGARTTLSNTIGSSNIVDDYSAIRWNSIQAPGILFRCVTGLGPSGNSNEELGHISFNGVQISHGLCDGPVVQPRGATIANFIGVINVELCSNTFTVNEEGVYTCTIRNSSMVDQTVRVGVYLPVRTVPVITTTLSTVNVEFGSPLTLSCTSQGSPPDTFTWMKNGTPAPLTPTLTTVTHDSTTAEFRSDYIINSVTTTDGGTYTCSIANSIGSDSLNIAVTINDVPDVIVTIVSSPAGTPVSGSTNTFDYPILSSVTLTCMVTLFNGGTYTGPYQWNTTGCYTNTGHNSGNPTCFPTGQTTQNVTNNNLLADDAGTITCTVPVNEVDYTSDPLTLRISGAEVVGGARTTLSNTIGSSNIVDDYSAIRWNSIQAPGILFRCVTGLGPSGNSNEELGHISFNGVQISHGLCDGPVVQPRGATIANFIGVINVELCSNTFTVNEEGVYTCTIMNSSMVDQTVRVGVYLPVRTVPVITTTLSTVNVEFGSPLTLSCTSQGSPPDTFTWMKNGTPAPLTPTLTTVTHNSTTAEFRSDYIINSVTTTDGGTYTCSIANPIGSDSLNIAVTITDVPDVIVTIVSSPAGTPVSGSTNTFDYPILSSVTLTCMVTLFNGGTYTGPYQWNTTGCYTNTGHNSGDPICFPTGQTTQNVTNNNLLADDAGTITCTVPVNDVDYTSDPLTLRISGAEVVGGARTTLSNTIGSSNIVDDYSAIRWNSIQAPGILFRCVTGLGPSGNSNEELGHISFNGVQISHGLCDGPVVQPRGATIANFIGVINVELCSNTFTVNEEGVYTCTIMNSSMVDQTVRVGVYLPVRTVPVITTTLSIVIVEFGSPLTLSCTSQGSPPDTFTWMKNGTPAPLTPTLTTVTHNSTTAEFRSDYIINSVTTTDGGTYTCSIANPIGSDSLNIAVTITDVSDVTVTIVSSPAGTPVNGSTNTFDYPILSSVTLTCMVTLSNGGTYTGPYQWNATGCYTNTGHNSGNPTCFPTGQTTQNVTDNNLLADDAGTITCTVTVNEVDYTSDPLTLRISVIDRVDLEQLEDEANIYHSRSRDSICPHWEETVAVNAITQILY
ncbi:mucin-2-like [Dysidea avara]|uniref:mucin-2-like n=1 Tax=Dysidea avara TaxID=196820 RepID=UPI00332F9334